MLTIRQRQIQALADDMFEAWMASHLSEFFHDEVAELTAAQIRGRIRRGAEQARRHGLSADADICRFIDLTFVLGPSFDSDRSLPWAADILDDDRLTDPTMRMDLLYEMAQEHVERLEQGESDDEAGA